MGEDVYFLDVMIELENFGDSILKNFGHLEVSRMQGVHFFIKLKNLSQDFVKDDKINFPTLIKLIEFEAQVKKLEYVNIATVRQAAVRIATRVFKSLKSIYNDSKRKKSSVRRMDIRELINPVRKEYLSLHSRICLSLNLEADSGYIELYKEVFTRTPHILIWVLYDSLNQVYLAVLYEVRSCQLAKFEMSERYVVSFLPLLKFLMKEGHY